MTAPAGAEAEVVAAPKLVHSGTYALYETPDGGRHLVYQQTLCTDAEGLAHAVETQDAHLPDIPPEALPLISSFIDHGFPPAVLALLSGKLSPVAVMKALRNGPG